MKFPEHVREHSTRKLHWRVIDMAQQTSLLRLNFNTHTSTIVRRLTQVLFEMILQWPLEISV